MSAIYVKIYVYTIKAKYYCICMMFYLVNIVNNYSQCVCDCLDDCVTDVMLHDGYSHNANSMMNAAMCLWDVIKIK